MQNQELQDDSINQLRLEKRKELSSIREKGRVNALRQRRLHLSEAEALVTNIPLDQFKELVSKIAKKRPTLELLKIIKNNCCTIPHIEAFFKTCGAFDSLFRALICQDGLLQLESAACLTNLVCGSHKASRRVAKGAGAYLLAFMSGKSPYLQNQCTWAVGNIAHDCFECLSMLKAQGILSALLVALESPNPEVIQSAVFTLYACTKYGDNDFKDLAVPKVRQILLGLLTEGHSPSNSDAALSLANIYYLCIKNNIEVHFEEGIQILQLLSEITSVETNFDTLITLALIRCLGFLSTSDALCVQFLQQKILNDIFIAVLHYPILRNEMLWVLTNIATLNCEDMFEMGIINKIIDYLQNPTETLTLQALYFLCVLATQSEKMKLKLLQTNIVSRVSVLTNCGEKSTEHACKYFCNLLNCYL